MVLDYHIHIEKVPYSKDRLMKFLDTGLRRGVSEFCITEHIHQFHEAKSFLLRSIKRMRREDIVDTWLYEHFNESVESYINFIDYFKNKGYPIKLGCELDYFEGGEEWIRSFTDKYPWDFVLGSLHWVNGWSIDNPDNIGLWENRVDDIYPKYFLLVKKAALSRLFNVIAHFDLVKLFGFQPDNSWQGIVEEVIKTIANNGIGIEVNTGGLRKPVKEIYPSKEILNLCKQYNVYITLGSDAHRPEDVGRDFGKAIRLLKQVGYNKVSKFKNRVREEISL
jgi:histidinol-phosphatase (PHP family)